MKVRAAACAALLPHMYQPAENSKQPELRLSYESVEALRADVFQNLSKARAFVSGVDGMLERTRCRLVLVHPEDALELEMRVEVVWVNPGVGVGVELLDFDADLKQRLLDFVSDSDSRDGYSDDDAEDEAVEDAAAAQRRRQGVRNLHERVRQLNAREREAMARDGSLAERVALERCYGGVVWEGLLRNPQLSPPEVMRIAKNGGLPKPLIGLIVGNAAWVSKPEVQRALLSNPRLVGANLDRVLRAMRRSDLERVATGHQYRMPVCAAAKKLLGS